MKISKKILKEAQKAITELNEEPIDEGMFDRIKANIAGAKTAMGSKATALAGKAAGALGASSAAGELEQVAQQRANNANIQRGTSLMKSHSQQLIKANQMIENMFKNLTTDLMKMGFIQRDPGMIDEIEALKNQATEAIKKTIAEINAT